MNDKEKQDLIDQFKVDEAIRPRLVKEIHELIDTLAEKDPSLIDQLANEIIPDGWEPTKPN